MKLTLWVLLFRSESRSQLTIFFISQYMASRGHRVIGCAQRLLPGDEYPVDFAFAKNGENCPTEGYCFVGLVSLEG